MKPAKFQIAVLFILFSFNLVKANDSLTLAEAYINLSLTANYFDTLDVARLSKIIPFLETELYSIKDKDFIIQNNRLYYFTFSILFYTKAKLLFRTKTTINRSDLLLWKSTLQIAIKYYSDCTSVFGEDPFYDFVGFKEESFTDLRRNIKGLKQEFTPYFNEDIYPDFKRIFYKAKNSEQYYFDSLSYYAHLYNINVSKAVLKNEEWKQPEYELDEYISQDYKLAFALDLVSRYLQLDYLSKGKSKIANVYNLYDAYTVFVRDLQPTNDTYFKINDNIISKDNFFRNELDQERINKLYQSLQKNYPFQYVEKIKHVEMVDAATQAAPSKYYFPDPAPFPSAICSVNHFLPGLNTMKQVNDSLKKLFTGAGYDGRLHYFYAHSGFAVTTSLEKINKDGSQVIPDQRWNLSPSGEGKFSFYDLFKAMFFNSEGDYRIIALIISPSEVRINKRKAEFSEISNLLKNSYSSLPLDLENYTLADKTLTILLYNFFQSDIGEVPMLDMTNKLTVQDHLKGSTLITLLK